MTNENEKLTGFLPVNKPVGCTSYDCIRKIKKLVRPELGKKVRIGHAGTLDPFASGLMIIAIGRSFTKQLELLSGKDKTYQVRAKLGQLTTTLDCEGVVLEDKDCSYVTAQQLQQAIDQLGQQYKQVPPVYSAMKYQGQRMHELARGQKMSQEELGNIAYQKARVVMLYEVKLLSVKDSYFELVARVSKGTYIRALVDDIAQQLGLHAAAHVLDRLKIGNLSVERSTNLDDLKSVADIENSVVKNLEI
ncbi:MAG: tRNA pseudouridine(55) synthase TruB [Epsilonproteobacteria bacterium]|nr:tRNA pseudouridine(55) synthase TruB [Campylobacterota bacterium]